MLPSLRAARHLVFVLAVALAFASAATCLAAVAEAKSEMPCHGSEQPPAQRSWIDCCPGDSPNTESLVPGQLTISPTAPSPAVVAVLPVAVEPQLSERANVVEAVAESPKPPGIPTYVFVSSFRI